MSDHRVIEIDIEVADQAEADRIFEAIVAWCHQHDVAIAPRGGILNRPSEATEAQ